MAIINQRRTDGRGAILNAAAQLFSERGYPQSSIRAIAAAAGIESSSLYYHFKSKEDILYAVEEEAFSRLTAHMKEALSDKIDPWERLSAACITHVQSILENREYITVTTKELPQDQSPESQQKFLDLRERYEDIFRQIVAELPLNSQVDRKYFRLALIGALASSLLWYREGGDSSETVARQIVSVFQLAGDPRCAKDASNEGRARPDVDTASKRHNAHARM